MKCFIQIKIFYLIFLERPVLPLLVHFKIKWNNILRMKEDPSKNVTSREHIFSSLLKTIRFLFQARTTCFKLLPLMIDQAEDRICLVGKHRTSNDQTPKDRTTSNLPTFRSSTFRMKTRRSPTWKSRFEFFHFRHPEFR